MSYLSVLTTRRSRAGGSNGVPDFERTLGSHGLELRRGLATTLQINVGKVCNQACHHCHVDAGPKRTERMIPSTAERALQLLEANPSLETVDITGGAPELNESFRFLVSESRKLGRRVLDRCNLTVLLQPGQEGTAAFLAQHQVGIIASLPCYQKENVEKQRGRGVFDKSIEMLIRLNELGYGCPGSPLTLDLVYNPVGAFLPPPQASLEERYRDELNRLFDIRFGRLYTITNMPIKRFADDLARSGKLEEYMSLLVNHFNPAAVQGLMCRTLISVGYDGSLYDCDFNQMLEIPLGGRRRSVWDLDDASSLVASPVATGPHCYGCTAGAGSSCGGAIT